MKKCSYILLFCAFTISVLAQERRSEIEPVYNVDFAKEIEKDAKAHKKAIQIMAMKSSTSSAVYQLDSMTYERYDSWDSTWYVDDLELLFYNGLKQCTGEMDFDFSPGRDTSYMTWYKYDTYGNWTEEIGASWSHGQWDTSWKVVMSYNSSGQYIGMIEYDYYNGLWENYWKSEYTYDSGGLLVSREYFDWDVNMWEPEYLEEYTYHTHGALLSEVEFDYETSGYERDDSTYYDYDAVPRLTKRERYRWDNAMWEYRSFYDYAYNSNGDLASRTYYYWYNNGWDTSYRYLYTFNQDYLMERIDQDHYNGYWKNNYKDVYTYDMNYVYPQFTANPYYIDDDWAMYLTEHEYQWDSNDSAWVDESHETFYWSHTGIGIQEETAMMIKLYPVPTTNQLTVELPNIEAAFIEIYDLTGSLKMQMSFNGGMTKLDMSAYPKGVYLILIKQERSSAVRKVVLQ